MKWKKTFAVAMSYMYILLLFLGCTYPCSCQEVKVEVTDASDETVKGKISGQVTELQKYQKLFEHNRAIQVDAVKSLMKSQAKYESKYKLTDTMVKKIFQVLEEAKSNLTTWGYLPGDDWPENKTIREAASNVVENVAMFGDLVLRLPDLVHSIYDKNKQWEFLIGWGVWFSMESHVFQGKHAKMLNLMSQELGLIPKEENYVNPYKESEILKFNQDAEELAQILEEKQRKINAEKVKRKSKETKAKRKGPKLSGMSHTEL